MVEICKKINILEYHEANNAGRFRALDRMVMVAEGYISVNGQLIRHFNIILWK